MYQSIIVPLDGSPRSERAIPVAVRLAKASGSVLEFVRVYTQERHDLDEDTDWEQMFRATMRKELETLAHSASETLGRSVSCALLDVPVIPALCDYIADRPDPLVVMTTHGRTGIGRAVLGSVADGLVRRGPAPVLMLRDSDQEEVVSSWRRKDGAFHVIVVPLDGTPLAEAAMAHAVAVARLTGARIHLVRVVSPLMAAPVLGGTFLMYPLPPIEGAKTQVDLAQEYLYGVERRVNSGGTRLNISTEIALEDRPATAIVSSCRHEVADLVVMSTHGRGSSRMLVRAVADKVIRDGVDAILLIRPTSVSLPAGLKTASGHKPVADTVVVPPLHPV